MSIENIKEYKRQYYINHKEYIKTKSMNYKIINKEKILKENKIKNFQLRTTAIESLGGFKCSVCGYDRDYRALQIHHINGGGTKERKTKGFTYTKFYKFISENPKESRKIYLVVCSNCNFILENIERNGRTANLHKKALNLFEKKCVHCGCTDERVLQFDHINGDGHKDRGINRSSQHISRKILNRKDLEKYQVLCANCNTIKKYEKNELRRRNKK